MPLHAPPQPQDMTDTQTHGQNKKYTGDSAALVTSQRCEIRQNTWTRVSNAHYSVFNARIQCRICKLGHVFRRILRDFRRILHVCRIASVSVKEEGIAAQNVTDRHTYILQRQEKNSQTTPVNQLPCSHRIRLREEEGIATHDVRVLVPLLQLLRTLFCRP
jgi:hypothetical protein